MRKVFIGFLFLFLTLSLHAQDYSPVDFPKHTMLDVKKRIFIKHNTDTVPLYRNDLYNMFLKLEKSEKPREITLGMQLTVFDVQSEEKSLSIAYAEKQIRYKISEDAEDYIIIDMKNPPPAPVNKKVARMRIPVELTDREKFLASFHEYFKIIPVPIRKYGEKEEEEEKTTEKVRNISGKMEVSKVPASPKKVEVYDMKELFQLDGESGGIEVLRTDLSPTIESSKNMNQNTRDHTPKIQANHTDSKNRPGGLK